MIPTSIKIFHIAHVDRLASIAKDDFLWCDAKIEQQIPAGTSIGMNDIKQRRLTQLRLNSHHSLYVGECVPFYFCPRSVMLYLINQGNHPSLAYRGGQGPILHFEADLYDVVNWANAHQLRWAFTLSNAGSKFFEDRNNLACLNEINWPAVQARDWQSHKEGKQAEFLLENRFPWHLVERIGVTDVTIHQQVVNTLLTNPHKPAVEIRPDWYY